MSPMDKKGWSSLTHSPETVEKTHHVPDTPQTRSPAYKLAFTDDAFMLRRELRPVRLQLELLKPDMILDERGIVSTVVMFGGARIPAPGGHAWAARNA
ncbi:MAG: 3-isopropylmalate dehydrogenase, partial [Rhizobiaceae bacterium]